MIMKLLSSEEEYFRIILEKFENENKEKILILKKIII